MEICEKQARSIKHQMTIAMVPLAEETDEFGFEEAPVNETLVFSTHTAEARMTLAFLSCSAGVQAGCVDCRQVSATGYSRRTRPRAASRCGRDAASARCYKSSIPHLG